ncbi:hypothetical protein GOQ27_07750 [Clostridium sp. D2Q-11]|uniref:Multicomponent Na+:H+ antiporter subunit B n=1 Tax=Anaeromonas frigoriresistens TaxID=2683708 RepID=A0A942UX05_9FIRM|nr:hypothetical protein [Anaeromonas frigoriresistens]MBS4538354.1 hypothetical protein [Anaeromonas frigoriresistens]
MIKKILVLLMLFTILVFFMITISDFNINTYTKDYLLENGYKETGSQNLITAVYLDYRLYDSIFEAGVLLVTVSGIIFMSKKDDEVL